MLGQIGEHAHNAGLQLATKGVVDGLELKADQRVVQVGNAAAIEVIA
jgi:hypothetical protein